MPVINEDIHRPLTVVDPSATTSPNGGADAGGAVSANGGKSKESSSTASLNKLLTGAGGGSSQCAITMKQSLSMTSLPAPSLQPSGSATSTAIAAQIGSSATMTTSHGDSGSEMIQARLRAERPYNSLKKKRGDDNNCNLWRRSWESHSSYSLNGGGSSSNGKDDFWAALQPNYNYIMDTNLIDSCREAHGEILELLALQETPGNSLNSCEKTTSPESHGSNLDPRRLRRWLREMENCILKSPTLSQAMRLKVGELQKLYEEHAELYCKIESQARVVGACIRSAEKEINERQQQQLLLQQEAEVNDEQNLNSIESTSSSQQLQKRSASSVSNVKGLEKRYHLLYLKAFEIQCMLESLLNKKEEQSPDSTSDKSQSDTDEEPAAKHRRLSPASDLSFRFGVQCGSQEIFHFYGDTAQCYDLVEESPGRGVRRSHSRISPPKRVNGSDADSEGSDCEKENKIQSVIIDQLPPPPPTSLSSTPLGSVSLEPPPVKLPFGDAAKQMRQATDQVDGAELALKTRMTIEEDKGAQQLLLEPAIGAAQVEPQEKKNQMAPQQRTPQKRLRSVDSSKFNRSARKSKNCATFYFKHLDTDGENQIGGFSSQNDEPDEGEDGAIVLGNDTSSGDLKSNEEDDDNAVATSDEEEWLYTNNKFNSTINAATEDAALPSASQDSLGKCTIPQISISEDSVFERDDGEQTNTERSLLVVVNGNGSYCHSSSLEQKPCSKESIHQLVLNAENLVREEVFLQQQQQQLSSSRRHHSHPQKLNQNYCRQSSSSPVLLSVSPQSAKCNGASSNYRSDAATAVYMASTMKVNCTPTKKSASGSSPSSARKCDQLKIKLVQEWLEQQPLDKTEPAAMFSNPATDCEASGEYTTESDCAQPDSDSSSSEGVTDSVATCCLQEGGARGASSSVGIGSTSRGTSTEIIGGSADLLSGPTVDEEDAGSALLNARDEVGDGLTPIQHSKVVMRNKRRNSERPWSVSSLSQLQKAVNRSSVTIGGSEAGGSSSHLIANFSISESALHTLSPSRTGAPKAHIKSSESRSSLKRRKYRMKRRSFGKRSDSGSEGGGVGGGYSGQHRESTKTLSKSESFSGNVNVSSTAIPTMVASSSTVVVVRRQSSGSNGSEHKMNSRRAINLNSSDKDSVEDVAVLVKPAFKLGSATNVYGASNLGALAKLSNYNRDAAEERHTSSVQKERVLTSHETAPEDLSSEQAWDNYQEKYNSENYSEGLDTEAVKRLLEFGDDDYRRHIDSQSDCCSSSLSAANNLDSLSPPRHRKFGFDSGNATGQQHVGSPNSIAPAVVPPGHCDSNVSSNTLRRRRALEFAEYERRRKNSDGSRKRFDDRRRSTESSHSYKYSPKHGSSDGSGRKKSSSVMQLKPRETCTSTDVSSEHDSTHEEDDLQIQSLLMQSRNNLERTEALRVRSHLLRAEDYAEILATCQENINGMGAMLRGPIVTVLSPKRCHEMRELLSSWESLAKWSENAAEAKRLQDEMHQLNVVIKGYGTHSILLESREAIEITIEQFQEEKVKLKSHRQTMLKLNSRVHSWVTRQENELQQQLAPTTTNSGEATGSAAVDNDGGQSEVGSAAVDQLDKVAGKVGFARSESVSVGIVMDKGALDRELHLRLKDEVSDLYNSWDEAEARINGQLIVLTSALQTWTQLEVGLGEFTNGLGKYRTLYELKDVLDRGNVQLPNDTVMDVRQVSRLLTERIEAYQQTKPQDATLLHPSSAILYSLKCSSNGSLSSDSGISDGGCGSDGGLSERERRLGSLRRLAKQLESNLAPGSAALNTIYQRLADAEDELKRLQELQETCREAVERLVRTSSPTGSAASTASVPLGYVEEEEDLEVVTDGIVVSFESEQVTVISERKEEATTVKSSNKDNNQKTKKASPQSKRKNKKRTSSGGSNGKQEQRQKNEKTTQEEEIQVVTPPPVVKHSSAAAWSGGDKVEDPDTEDIDLLLLNNYKNYKSKNGGYLLEDGIEELDREEPSLVMKDRDIDEDDFDSDNGLEEDSEDEVDAVVGKKKKGWAWRVARIAVPLQFALISLFCVARLFEPQCCDVVNNFSMSFTPHLRYVRGPPPM